jgi:hypothetical protein
MKHVHPPNMAGCHFTGSGDADFTPVIAVTGTTGRPMAFV